jgi:hypothetical protein
MKSAKFDPVDRETPVGERRQHGVARQGEAGDTAPTFDQVAKPWHRIRAIETMSPTAECEPVNAEGGGHDQLIPAVSIVDREEALEERLQVRHIKRRIIRPDTEDGATIQRFG